MLFANPLPGQTAVPDGSGHLVFRRNAHTVVLDIVVTGKNGQPALGLHKEDFQISEDGHPQTATYFEPHTSQTEPGNLPDLPANVFTNIPRITPTDSVTVLLLDALNTQLQDQNRVQAEIFKFLKTLPPGRRVAIFTLGNRLRFIQGFTDDPALLTAALNDPRNSSTALASPLLKSNADVSAENQPLATLTPEAGSQPSAALTAALNNLKQFQAEQTSSRNDVRVSMTIDAFQELAHYLAGIPGRKNVVWFSSAFPLILFPDTNLRDEFATQREFGDKIKQTDALVAAAQIAVYPVAAEGLATDAIHSAEQRSGSIVAAGKVSQPVLGGPESQAINEPVSGLPFGEQAIQQENGALQNDALGRNGTHTAMDVIARDTGGQAFYNTNGLNEAIARAADDGSNFYTLTYTPTNTAEDGRFRKITVTLPKQTSVNVSGKNMRLAYRRGYYADKAATLEAAGASPAGDPLHPFMGPGMPASTQVPFAMRVTRGSRQPGGHATANERTPPDAGFRPAGDNPDLARLVVPLTRYKIDFVIAARGLQLEQLPSSRHGQIETTLVAYSPDGKPLNWLVRQINLDMDEARFAKVQENGVNFSFEVDVPDSAAFLRAGVYDQLSNLTGTLEIPLSNVQSVSPASHAMR